MCAQSCVSVTCQHVTATRADSTPWLGLGSGSGHRKLGGTRSEAPCDHVTQGQCTEAAGGGGAGGTDLRRVGGPGVDPPEELAAWNDLHGLLSRRHSVRHVTVGFLGSVVLEQGTPVVAGGEWRPRLSDQFQAPEHSPPPSNEREAATPPVCDLSVPQLKERVGRCFCRAHPHLGGAPPSCGRARAADDGDTVYNSMCRPS